MNDSPTNKKLATLMSVIFATHFITIIYGMCAGAVMYKIGPKVYNLGNAILYLPIIISAILIAVKNDLHITKNARIFSWIFVALQTFSFLNIVLYLLADNNLTGFIGTSAHIIFPLIYAISTILFYISLHLWSPVKVLGVLSALPNIVSGFLFFQIAGKEFTEDIMQIYEAIGTIAWISGILYLASFVLALIWALKKPVAPSMKTNNIDII